MHQVLDAVTDAGRFADLVAGYIELPVAERQGLLENLSVEDRLRRVLVHVQRQIGMIEMQEEIKSQVQEELGERQREMYLREQMKAIQKELGDDDQSKEISELREKLDKLELPPTARAEVERELGRLERAGRESMEAQVIRTYLEWIAELPWNTRSDDNLDLISAQTVLDEDHYGLPDVKDRVLEFLAVRQLRAQEMANEVEQTGEVPPRASRSDKDDATPSLVSGGRRPPRDGQEGGEGARHGEGTDPAVLRTARASARRRSPSRSRARSGASTCASRSAARATKPTSAVTGAPTSARCRAASSRGSSRRRRAIPSSCSTRWTSSGQSFQGDPSSALLEVLDPAQNDTFTDHYLGIPFDLSEVLFIATANFIQNIPGPLLDRMEVVEFAGYTEREKAEIAKKYLMPRQLEESGLKSKNVVFTDDAVMSIVSKYTRESGVRQLERQVGAVARKVARKLASGETDDFSISVEDVRELLGRPRVHPEHANEENEVGVAAGMYYTPMGGDIMFVEAAIRRLHGAQRSTDGDDQKVQVSGWGNVSLILTGQLGDVMKESARAALTYAATHASALKIPEDRLGSIEVHVHVPAGAIPKDGPSAGVAISTALVSAMSGRPVRREVAMTGEATLRGRVLPIGGLKEKVLGAHRAGITTIILPKDNEADMEDIPEEVRNQLTFHPVSTLDEAFAIALMPAPNGTAPAAKPTIMEEAEEAAATAGV